MTLKKTPQKKILTKLSTQWFQGYSDPEGLKSHLLNSSNVLALQRLLELLDKKEKELARKEIAPETLESPNWPHLQATILGQKQTIQWMKDLLQFVQERKSK